MADQLLADQERLVSPLAGITSGTPRQRQAAIRATHHGHFGCLVLRGQGDDAAFLEAAAAALGTQLPLMPRSVARTDTSLVLWQSPDEWWVLCARSERARLTRALPEALKDCFAQVVDNTGGLVALQIEGQETSTLLRHLTPYDVDTLKPGSCAATVMSKASVSVLRTGSQTWFLFFRRSFARYVWQLLDRAALPYGLAIEEAPLTHFMPALVGQLRVSGP